MPSKTFLAIIKSSSMTFIVVFVDYIPGLAVRVGIGYFDILIILVCGIMFTQSNV